MDLLRTDPPDVGIVKHEKLWSCATSFPKI